MPMNPTNIATRRDFLHTLLAACTSYAASTPLFAQGFPRDNAFQVRLSHLFSREGSQLRQILLADVPSAGSWIQH